jgi:hypothetical protein
MSEPLVPTPAAGPIDQVHEPPVVARLVVEIRSDGRLTIARGALEDAITGERTAIEARGATPMALVTALARMVRHLPSLARRAARAVLPGRR